MAVQPNPVICAIDTPHVQEAAKLAAEVKPHVGAIKLGLEFFTANGPAGIRAVQESGAPLFLDLKFHDIPNTVAGAIRSACALGAFITTIHAGGGRDMMKAAIEAAKEAEALSGTRPLVVGVTVLTSMDAADIAEVGVQADTQAQVRRLALLARESGLDGIVCSPHEITAIRAECGKDFTLVVPGIRPAGSEQGDQKRIMTPAEALQAGADYLVIGRPITQAASPAQAAQAIAATFG